MKERFVDEVVKECAERTSRYDKGDIGSLSSLVRMRMIVGEEEHL